MREEQLAHHGGQSTEEGQERGPEVVGQLRRCVRR